MEAKTQQKYNELAKQYFDENKTIDEKTLSAFLQKWAWKLYDLYDKDCKREDIKMELEEMERTATDDEIEYILDRYEDTLSDDDCWHYHLQSAIEWVLGEDEGEE